MDILERLAMLRDERGLSNCALAKLANLPPTTVNTWFKKECIPSIPVLKSICRALGITLSQFFSEDGKVCALSDSQILMLKEFDKLTVPEQKLLYDYLKGLNQIRAE